MAWVVVALIAVTGFIEAWEIPPVVAETIGWGFFIAIFATIIWAINKLGRIYNASNEDN